MPSLRRASLISTSLQGILYGFSVLAFVLTLWILLKRRERRRTSQGMIAISCALQILATAQLIVDILRLCQAFLSIGPSLLGGPEQYFRDVSQVTFVVKSCLYNTQTLILDGVVIYRAYIVWQNIYVTIIPVLCWFALFATCIALNVSFATASDHAENIFDTATGRWITTVWSLTLVTNLSASSLIAFRVWRVHRQSTRHASKSHLAPVLRVVIESGTIYSITITAALIAFVAKSIAAYGILDMISPIIVIVFNLIIIRVGFASLIRLPVIGTFMHQSWVPGPYDRENISNIRYAVNREHMTKTLEVEITQYFEIEADSTSTVVGNQKGAGIGESDNNDLRPMACSQPDRITH